MPRKVPKRVNNARGQRMREAAAERVAAGIAGPVFGGWDGLPRQTMSDADMAALYARHGTYARHNIMSRAPSFARIAPPAAVASPWRGSSLA